MEDRPASRAETLGMSTTMIRRYESGVNPDGSPVVYNRLLELACSALANDLRPWSEYER